MPTPLQLIKLDIILRFELQFTMANETDDCCCREKLIYHSAISIDNGVHLLNLFPQATATFFFTSGFTSDLTETHIRLYFSNNCRYGLWTRQSKAFKNIQSLRSDFW